MATLILFAVVPSLAGRFGDLYRSCTSFESSRRRSNDLAFLNFLLPAPFTRLSVMLGSPGLWCVLRQFL